MSLICTKQSDIAIKINFQPDAARLSAIEERIERGRVRGRLWTLFSAIQSASSQTQTVDIPCSAFSLMEGLWRESRQKVDGGWRNFSAAMSTRMWCWSGRYREKYAVQRCPHQQTTVPTDRILHRILGGRKTVLPYPRFSPLSLRSHRSSSLSAFPLTLTL